MTGFNRSIKKLATIDNKVKTIIENYEPQKRLKLRTKKRVVSILNKTMYDLLDYYLDPNTTETLH